MAQKGPKCPWANEDIAPDKNGPLQALQGSTEAFVSGEQGSPRFFLDGQGYPPDALNRTPFENPHPWCSDS